jgi:hypothetical protein
MWLVLCEPTDLSAIWAWKGLRARGMEPVELVTSHALAYNLRFEHRIGCEGSSTIMTLADGRVINSATVRGTLNRLQQVPTAHLQAANTQDKQYAEQELHALFLSWLSALPGPLINKPTPRGLCGAWRPISEWAVLGARAGLPTEYHVDSDLGRSIHAFPCPKARSATGVVLQGRCFGALPADLWPGSARLSELADTALLQVEFVRRDTSWRLADATPLPDLREGGEQLLQALTESLVNS